MYAICKRGIDVTVSLFLILLASPVLVLVAIVLKLTGEHEVLYLQKRIGYKNRYFNIYKFATMLKASPNLGTKSITLRGDPRVLPFGKYLRATKINELPQLFNVLTGDMSLVGPRPFVDETFASYPQHVQEKVYDCPPGLTGIGSVIYRDEESIISSSPMEPTECYREMIAPHKGELELWYQTHRSLWTDALILFLTAAAIVVPSTGRWAYRIFPDLPQPGAADLNRSAHHDPCL